MTIDEYTKAVKVKIDEVSPYEEPTEYDDNDDAAFRVVKPIVATIIACLPKAVWFCLNNLPLTLLARDIEEESVQVNVDVRGVGHVTDMDRYKRFARLCTNEWNRAAVNCISTSDPSYILQQNMHTRGGANKPVVVYSPETAELELYSFGKCGCARTTNATLYSVNCNKSAERVKSPIEDFIVLMCAAYVEEIMGDANAAQVFQAEYNNKQQTVLQ